MSWAGVIAGGVAVGSWALNKYAGPKKGGGGGGAAGGGPNDYGPMIDIPDFYNDPNYGKSQDKLMSFGSDLLDGHPNDYYAPIGEVGGSMFEDVLAKVVRDTTGATENSAIRRGVGRGGSVSSAIGKNVADISSTMRWSDFTRAMEGRKGLLNVGDSMVTGVRGAALTNQSQKNNYELNKVKLLMGQEAQLFDEQGKIGEAQGGATAGIFDQVQNLAGAVGPLFSKGGAGTTQRYLTQEQLQDQNTKPMGSASGSGGMDWVSLLTEAAKMYAMTKS